MVTNLTNLANPGYQCHRTCSGSSVRLVAVLLDVGGGSLDEGQSGEWHRAQGHGRLGGRGRVAAGGRRVAVAFRMQALWRSPKLEVAASSIQQVFQSTSLCAKGSVN